MFKIDDEGLENLENLEKTVSNEGPPNAEDVHHLSAREHELNRIYDKMYSLQNDLRSLQSEFYAYKTRSLWQRFCAFFSSNLVTERSQAMG